MGVYIPGMKMPTSCSECAFCGYYGNKTHLCDINQQAINYDDMLENRRDDCPLVPVPEHGDLIDKDATIGKIGHIADEIDKKLGYEKSAPYIMMSLYLNNVDDFPTILPADKEERNVT